jgi:hypothetical protein
MSSYIVGAPIKKHRFVAGGGSSYTGGPESVIPIEMVSGSQGKLFAAGKPIERYENGFLMLAAPGLAIGIAQQSVSTPGERTSVADRAGETALIEAGEPFEPESELIADAEGRAVVVRPGLRASEPILAIAVEGADKRGEAVAVRIAAAGLRT